MLDAAFIFGVLCAVAGACAGRRAAFAMLVNAAIGLAFNELGVTFNLALWFVIDLAVIAVIAAGNIRLGDRAIIALFVPLWITYFVPSQAGYAASVLVSALQMVLTLPVGRIVQRWRHTAVNHHHWSDFDLRVSHGDA